MRILVDYRPALRHRTGVGEYVHELVRALVRTAALPDAPGRPQPPDREELFVFSSSWRDRLDPDAVPGAAPIDRHVPVRLLNLAWHRFGWPPAELLTGVDFDVVHSAHPLLLPARHAAQVVTVHDLDFLEHPERTSREIRRDYPTLAPSHIRRADAVIAVSKHTASEVTRLTGVETKDIAVCPLGRPAWPRRVEEPRDGVILFLGTLEPRKNIGVLLDAYERLISRLPAAPKLLLAGALGPGAEALVARTGRAPLAGRVEMPGYVDPADRQALYGRALVLVMPSFLEGFGLPALEAMTVGVPVIAANRGALPELTGRAARLFDPLDSEALAVALADVLGDPAARLGMRDRGWQEADRYSWDITANKTREAWSRARERRAARG